MGYGGRSTHKNCCQMEATTEDFFFFPGLRLLVLIILAIRFSGGVTVLLPGILSCQIVRASTGDVHIGCDHPVINISYNTYCDPAMLA